MVVQNCEGNKSSRCTKDLLEKSFLFKEFYIIP
jgi:hypothetical protein